MFLSNSNIREYIEKGKINVTGEINIETHGISINLGDEILIPMPNQTLDSQNPVDLQYQRHNLNNSPYILKPNDFVLGITKQSINTSKDIITMIDGRSTFARAGMTIHTTAMVLDGVPFNNENSVLEIKNLGNLNIVLHANEYVGTYIFALLDKEIEGEKVSNYSNQDGVVPPKF